MEKTLVGIYRTESEAAEVVRSLRSVGIGRHRISLLRRKTADDDRFNPEKTRKGMPAGSVLGALTRLLTSAGILTVPGIGPTVVAGPLVTLFTGLGAATVIGRVVGVLREIGIPEDEARDYLENVRRGDSIVLVTIETSDVEKASKILPRSTPLSIKRPA